MMAWEKFHIPSAEGVSAFDTVNGLVDWVRQDDAMGCRLACVAMVLGITYAEAKAEAERIDGPTDWETQGADYWTSDRILYRHGWAVQRHYVAWYEDWPLEPFAPLHLIEVLQPSGRGHSLVMDAGGRVFDPNREGVFTLADYPQVQNIQGLFRVAAVAA